MVSVTSFGEILPVSRILQSWAIYDGLFSNWQNIKPTLEHLLPLGKSSLLYMAKY